jgi:hypothetical protein
MKFNATMLTTTIVRSLNGTQQWRNKPTRCPVTCTTRLAAKRGARSRGRTGIPMGPVGYLVRAQGLNRIEPGRLRRRIQREEHAYPQ